MSTGVLNFKNEAQNKKRLYSKKGCRECKRRKIKCDEEKPECWQCRRLKKSCAYPEVGEKVYRVSKKVMNNNALERKLEDDNSIRLNSFPSATDQNHDINGSTKYRGLQTSGQIENNTKFKSPSIVNLLNDANQESESNKENNTQLLEDNNMFLLNKDGFFDFNPDDFNLLAGDFNDIVSNLMFEGNFDTKHYKNDLESLDSFFDEHSHFLSQDEGHTKDIEEAYNREEYTDNPIQRNIPMDYVKVKTEKERAYIQVFYDIVCEVLMPFKAYDESINSYFNPIRDILLGYASKEPFILAAVLALGANTSFEQSGAAEDKEALFKYLSKCLKMLEPSLQNNDEKDKKVSASNIEMVLITVLLITSINTMNATQEWRPHLKGAKDILLKYSLNHAKYARLKYSNIMIFSKFMFSAYECLAGLSAKSGGTLKNDEMDLLICSGDAHEVQTLERSGVILRRGFNVFFGYHNSCIPHMRDLIKILNKIRSKNNNFEPDDSLEYIRLISEFQNQRNLTFVSKKYILSESDFDNQLVPDNLSLDIAVIDNVKFIVNWMDISHQLYVLAAMLTILTSCFQLSYKSTQVQALISKLMEPLSFLESYLEELIMNKSYVMIVQWPIYVAGLNCISEQHKLLVTKCFIIASEAGSRTAELTLKRVRKIWDLHSKNKDLINDDDDDDMDIVTY